MVFEKLFIDTNVFLDFYLVGRSNHKKYIDFIFNLIFQKKIEGAVADFSIINLDYFLKQRYKVPKLDADEFIRLILNYFEVISATKDDLNNGLALGWKDYEDCIQFLCANNCNADLIITQNIKDFSNSSIKVYSPKSFYSNFHSNP
jgi:predicted nucleic acid-binding protein